MKTRRTSIYYSTLSDEQLAEAVKSRIDGSDVYAGHSVDEYAAGEMAEYGIERRDALLMLLTKMDARPIR